MSGLRIRPATPADAEDVVRLVKALAVYEESTAEVVSLTAADVRRDGFGDGRRFEALLAENGNRVVGLALYFEIYSTWDATTNLFLEDFYVEAEARGRGIGRALLAELARIGLERRCRRLEFHVSDWNPSRDFYHRLGAGRTDRTLLYRLNQAEMTELARADEV